MVSAAAVLVVWYSLRGPSIGVIRTSETPLAVTDEFDASKGWKSFQGTYIDLTYAAKYQKQQAEVPEKSPIRESVLLTTFGLESTKIAIIVEARDGIGLEESPSFQMRVKDVETYKQSPFVWQQLDGALFTKHSQVFEQTVFFRRGEQILSVAVTSPLRIDFLEEELKNVLQHLQWKTEG